MQDQSKNRTWQTIEIPAKDFDRRLNQLSEAQTATGALFSRLALIHQAAKSLAVEAVSDVNSTPTNLEIEELTDPPLYGYTLDDDPIIIQFSYYNHP